MISTPRKRRNGKRIALVTVLIAFLLIELALLGIVLGTIVYQKYILPRPVEYTTFAPLERRIFDLDASEITEIEYTGNVDVEKFQERIKANPETPKGLLMPRYEFETRDEIEEIVEYLNSFRYSLTAPGPDYRHMNYGTESECCLVLYTKQKDKSLGMTIQKNRVHIGEVWYYGDPEYFSRFMGIEAKLLDGTFSGF